MFQNDSRFQACVSESITKILGCKLKWELLAGDTTAPNCTTVSHFRYDSKFPNHDLDTQVSLAPDPCK